MTIENIQEILLKCYSKDLCYPQLKSKWSEDNKCLGMCAITALIINDYFNGEICKIHVDGTSHYFNLIDDKIIDLTSSQFDFKINYENYEIADRAKMLTDNTKQRYNCLKEKIIKLML